MLLLILLHLISYFTAAVDIKDCGSISGEFSKIEISNCDFSGTSCVLKKGHDASISITFTPNKDCSKVTSVIHGLMGEIDVPFPIPNAEACFFEDSGIVCPLAAHTENVYYLTLPVLKQYPTVSLSVRWELKDEEKNNIVCIEVPVSLQ